MRRILYIINPVAGRKKGSELLPLIKRRTEEKGLDYGIKISSRIGNGVELASKAVLEGYTDVVAVGGDGTVTEVLNGLFNKPVNMGIIPSGTGNDFIRSLGIPSSPEAALECVLEGAVRKIDVGIINGQPFLNVVSMGIDGQIIMDYEHVKKRIHGSSAYLFSTFKTLATFDPVIVKVTTNNFTETVNAVLVAVGNGKYFGGGMKITPEAELDDGLLDVCLVEAMPRWTLMKFFPKVFSGEHIHVKSVKYFKCDHIEIESINREIPVNSDGNLIGWNKAVVSIEKSCQNFLVCNENTASKKRL